MHLQDPIIDTTPPLQGGSKEPSLTTHSVPTPDPNPIPEKALYFAFGSNLSPTQMRHRCPNALSTSTPLAIARLPSWRWFICSAGYANVLPPADLRVGRQKDAGEQVPVSGKEDAVYGVLYDMHPRDEELLDGFEGVDKRAPLGSLEGPGREIRPREQGSGEYNKWFLDAEVVSWLDGTAGEGDRVKGGTEKVKVLVYVDEESVDVGVPKKEYIGRMNRGIREAIQLGFPVDWTEEVMRRFIPDV